jgi:UDP-2-acetamido-3-amino-2,3-dideoxy-glucuronate N-acetyltransferase
MTRARGVAAGLSPSATVHESAYVDEGATVGPGTRIWHFCHVMPGAVIGPRCNLGQNVVVMGGTRLGENVKVQNNVSIYEGVELEDDVFCGPSMVFTNVVNPRSHVSRKHEYLRTLVRRGATIGANATVVCGVTLGEYAFVGAGAVVTRDVPAHALVAGVPARRIGWVCSCGVRLPDAGEGTCAACGSVYARSGDGIVRTGGRS